MVIETPRSEFYKGEGSMSQEFFVSETVAFKLIYVRAHFRLLSGSGGLVDLIFSLDSVAGEEFDCTLFTAENRGVGKDANIVMSGEERRDPSPWSFPAGDKLLFSWAGLSNVAWGLEVGYQV